MLQQTQVARVRRRPTGGSSTGSPALGAARGAGLGEVLRAWAGLGYNRRARNLHRAAEAIVAEHGGRVPEDLRALRRYPGSGRTRPGRSCPSPSGTTSASSTPTPARVLARAVAGRALGRRRRRSRWPTPWCRRVGPGSSTSRCSTSAPPCAPAGDRDAASCRLAPCCAWAERGWSEPDPAEGTAGASRAQPPFAGSDRQGRGRLVDALRTGPGEVSRRAAHHRMAGRAGEGATDGRWTHRREDGAAWAGGTAAAGLSGAAGPAPRTC